MGKARTSAKPVRLSATSNLHVPSSMPGKEKEGDRRMQEGLRKWIEKRWARLLPPFFLLFFFFFFFVKRLRDGVEPIDTVLN